VRRFATVGTGSGTDVIAALEALPDLEGVAMTDLHQAVVETAKQNVLSATQKSDDGVRKVAKELYAAAGDVLMPLRDQEPFDLIYE
jgi:methylase of polypeptide subunit release factors